MMDYDHPGKSGFKSLGLVGLGTAQVIPVKSGDFPCHVKSPEGRPARRVTSAPHSVLPVLLAHGIIAILFETVMVRN